MSKDDTWYTFGYRGMAYNLLFVVYLLTLQPFVVATASEIFQHETPSLVFGVLLLVVMGIEAVVLPRKMRDVFARSDRDLPPVVFLVWIFHMVVSVILGIHASLAVGLAVDRSVLMPIIVVKELALGTALVRPGKKPTPLTAREALWVDLGLLLFSCIAYGTIWEAGVGRFTIHLPTAGWYDLISFFVLCPVLVFMMVLPIRLPFFAEELVADQSRKGRIHLILSFVVLVVIALAPSIENHPSPEDISKQPLEQADELSRQPLRLPAPAARPAPLPSATLICLPPPACSQARAGNARCFRDGC